jgi:hypothetical protein
MEIRIRRARAAGKTAEAAADKTNVGEINVAVHDVGDGVADGFAPQSVGCDNQRIKRRTFGCRQLQRLLETEFSTLAGRGKVIAYVRWA